MGNTGIDLTRRRNVVHAFGLDYVFCKACERYLPVADFPRSKAKPSGLHPYCLECNRAKGKAERERRGDEYRAWRKAYRDRTAAASWRKYVARAPWQKWAQAIVWRAIKHGRMVKPTECSVCGKGGIIDGHHDDYAKPLEVRWLCRWCHQEWHRIHGEAANANPSVIKRRG